MADTQKNYNSLKLLIAEGVDFPISREELYQSFFETSQVELNWAGAESLKVFQTQSDQKGLQSFFDSLRNSQTIKETKKQSAEKTLVVFTSKRAVKALADFTSNGQENLLAYCLQNFTLTCVGKQTHDFLYSLASLSSAASHLKTNIVFPAPTNGIEAALKFHENEYQYVKVLGTNEGFSETFVNRLKDDARNNSENENRNETQSHALSPSYEFYKVYETVVETDLANTLARFLGLESEQKQEIVTTLVCCLSGKTVEFVAGALFSRPELRVLLGNSLYFLPFGASAQRAVKLRALPTWPFP
jgi:hypothetical protein